MDLEQMKKHYSEFDQWIETLRELSESQWQAPLGEGKWSVAAVVSHMLLWDKYSLEERFPYFKEGAALPAYPDFQSVNDQASEYAVLTPKDQILDELKETRKGYHEILNGMTKEKLAVSFMISTHSLTVEEYIADFIQHDLHHQKQVNEAIGKTITQ